MTPTYLSKNSGKIWAAASVVALPYFVTSVLIVIRSFFWLPSFPSIWYGLQGMLYWPFQPYLDFTLSVMSGQDIPYSVYSGVSRSPFLVIPMVVWAAAWRRAHPTYPVAKIESVEGEKEFFGRKEQAIVVVIVATILAILYFNWFDFRFNVDLGTSLLVRGDVPGLKDYLLSFGIWAPGISAALMVLQSIAAPLPAFVITFANGLLFGALWGTLLSWSSAMVGAIVCYYIAMILGRPAVEKLVGAKGLQITDRFFSRYGRYAILLARLIPIISFDVISYAAGMTSVSLLEFTVATGIGQLPATIIYSYLGESLTSSAQIGLWAVIGVLSLLALALAAKTYFESKLAATKTGTGPHNQAT